MEHDERYQVRNPEIERALRTLAALVDAEVPAGWAWGLFLAPFGVNAPAPEGIGAVFWISNADRAGMVESIKGWIEDQERRARGAQVSKLHEALTTEQQAREHDAVAADNALAALAEQIASCDVCEYEFEGGDRTRNVVCSQCWPHGRARG